MIYPLFNGVEARPYAAGGTARQHKAHMDRLAWMRSKGMTPGADVEAQASLIQQAAAMSSSKPTVLTSFLGGSGSVAGLGETDEAMSTAATGSSVFGGTGTTGGVAAAVDPYATFGSDPTTWPDSAFPQYNGVAARPMAAGGTREQHAAHKARNTALGRTTGTVMERHGSTIKTALIVAGVAVAGLVAFKMFTPKTQKTGIAGYFDRAKKLIA